MAITSNSDCAEPLKEVVIEELRLISDGAWFDAQLRLANEGRNGGRRSRDGDRQSRPKLLNGILTCPEHNRPLHVSGPNGRQMHCPSCYRLPAEQRPLFSALPRALTVQLICTQFAELIRGDKRLIDDALAACDLEIEAAEMPDPNRLAQLRFEIGKRERSIEITRRTAGEMPGRIESGAEQLIKQLQREKAAFVAETRKIEAGTPGISTAHADKGRSCGSR